MIIERRSYGDFFVPIAAVVLLPLLSLAQETNVPTKNVSPPIIELSVDASDAPRKISPEYALPAKGHQPLRSRSAVICAT